jgi:hypothetical protein
VDELSPSPEDTVQSSEPVQEQHVFMISAAAVDTSSHPLTLQF